MVLDALPDQLHSLLSASPAMCRLASSSRAQLVPVLMGEFCNHTLLQDSLAIVLFPRPETASEPAIQVHLEAHQAGILVFPPDLSVADRLVTLWLLVIQLAEDYLGKATHSYPPRAYHQLPAFSLPPTRNHGSDEVSFDFCDLTPTEQKRMVWAFLRFELLAKLRHSEHYNWTLETQRPRLRSKHYDEMEAEMLTCIEGYVGCLYGAIFARKSDAWLPCRPKTVMPQERRSGLVYPDSVCFSPEAYAEDLGVSGLLVSYLSSHGIALAVRLVRATLAGELTTAYLSELSRSVEKVVERDGFQKPQTSLVFYRAVDRPLEGRGLREPQTSLGLDAAWDRNTAFGSTWSHVPGMAGLLYPRLQQRDQWRLQLSEFDRDLPSSYRDRFPWMYRWRADPTQSMMYRQRAWVFLDDWRLYPLSWTKHFPLWVTMDALKRRALDCYLSASQSRVLHRSGQWNLDHATEKSVFETHRSYLASTSDRNEEDGELPSPSCVLERWKGGSSMDCMMTDDL